MATTFYTLRFVQTLRASGITQEHAEATARAFADAAESELVTKLDLKLAWGELEHRLIDRLQDLKIQLGLSPWPSPRS